MGELTRAGVRTEYISSPANNHVARRGSCLVQFPRVRHILRHCQSILPDMSVAQYLMKEICTLYPIHVVACDCGLVGKVQWPRRGQCWLPDLRSYGGGQVATNIPTLGWLPHRRGRHARAHSGCHISFVGQLLPIIYVALRLEMKYAAESTATRALQLES